tara:strand:- start:27 stop:332 length:306 start_codon:yes stop_codon:yes gene_type:complete
MPNNKIIAVLEYLSLVLVLSFFLFQNIFIVIIGSILSIFAINKNSIYKYFEFNKFKNIEKQGNNSVNGTSKELIKENSALSLVEIIEEIGIIPSKDNDRAA